MDKLWPVVDVQLQVFHGSEFGFHLRAAREERHDKGLKPDIPLRLDCVARHQTVVDPAHKIRCPARLPK
ncbi:hypothetical protein D3C80_1673510 [compost metagenome]